MGYHTTYELSTKGNKYKVSDIIFYMKKQYVLSKENRYYPFDYEFDNLLFDERTDDILLCSYDAVKWYNSDEEMKDLSKQFPETVFCLYGIGENNGDIWYKYYKNGKSQYCPAKIVFDEYDESKLA